MKYGDVTLGQIEAAINKLGGLDGFNALLRDELEIRPLGRIIDCDADPFIPEGWLVEEHQKGGSFKWNPDEVKLCLSEPQRCGKTIGGYQLRKLLEGQPVLNANVLDWLLAHQKLIPGSWKEKTGRYTTFIFFWGTIYRDSGGSLYVRCLYWGGGEWISHYYWLARDWRGDLPAAVRAR